MSDDAVVGRTGTVVVPIRGAHGDADLTGPVRGGTETFLAYALQEIAEDAIVLVIASRGARSVDVQPWG
jgi:membrane protein implicated in regulation of membrane protease activity